MPKVAQPIPTSYVSPDLFAPSPAAWPFGDLRPLAYDLIMADPPWSFANWSEQGEEKNASAHYRCMSIEAINAMPVADLAKPDCLLWLWATAPMLDQQIDTLRRWGFEFATSGVWCKTTVTGKQAFGTGYILRNAHDPFLIGKRGSPRTARDVRSAFLAPTRGHTRKPELAFQMAERMMPAARRCELFAWTRRPGWDAWGDEVGRYEMEEQARGEEARRADREIKK